MGLFKTEKETINEAIREIDRYMEHKKNEIKILREELQTEQKAWEERKNTMLLEKIREMGWKVTVEVNDLKK